MELNRSADIKLLVRLSINKIPRKNNILKQKHPQNKDNISERKEPKLHL